jgi:ABC-2 type transport system ATP-binding protein
VMLQVANVPETLRVREHVHLFASYYPSPMPVDAALEAAGIKEIANRKYGELSGGQKQRVHFALAICGNPELLFLDEPTVGLDVESRRAFWQEVRRLIARGRAILLTTHYIEEADALADRVVILNNGTVVGDGTPAEMKRIAASRRIRCVTSLAPERIRQMPGVSSVRHDGAMTELLTNDAERVARELLLADSTLTGLEITGAGLEEAFLTLTSTTAGAAEPVGAGGVR